MSKRRLWPKPPHSQLTQSERDSLFDALADRSWITVLVLKPESLSTETVDNSVDQQTTKRQALDVQGITKI
jgi:hypothetical protein